MAIYLVIFGAAVLPDGLPSGSLRRRVAGALAAARGHDDWLFLATGGVGRHGGAEAELIAELLVFAGVGRERILIEARARDTLQSARRCHALLVERGDAEILVCCSSSYHNPRCALLLRLLGYRVRVAVAASDRAHLGVGRWALAVLKECIALPYDAGLLLAHRWAGLGAARAA